MNQQPHPNLLDETIDARDASIHLIKIEWLMSLIDHHIGKNASVDDPQ